MKRLTHRVQRCFTRLLCGFSVLSCLLLAPVLQAQTKETLLFAVLAFEAKAETQARWQPIIDEVNQGLSAIELQVKALNFDEMYAAVQHHEVDFVLLNSALYVELSQRHGLSSPLASMIGYHRTTSLRGFGGVMLVRNEPGGLTTVQQLKGRRVAVPMQSSFGGYMMQAYALQQQGIKPADYKVVETGMTHQSAVLALLKGEADAAFVRTGVFESMQERGLVNEQALNVLNAQQLRGFPLALSTQLYPEWPLAAMPHVHPEHAAQVAGAFLTMHYRAPVLQESNVYGFSIPADYEPVREVMRALKVRPYHLEPRVTWQQAWLSYKTRIMLGSAFIATILLLSALLLLYNRRLAQTLVVVRKNEESQRLSAVAFETQEAIFITDAHEQILRANQAFTNITGYTTAEVLGKTPRIFSSGKHDVTFFQCMWRDIITSGGWRGEIWNRNKDGEMYPIHQVISAVKNAQGQVTHYLSTFSDISARKQAEERIHQLAYYDPLTGLANRRLLQEHIQQALTAGLRNRQHSALLFVDLDHFKQLNDSLGYQVGDELLKQVAERIEACVHVRDVVARQSGDDFIVLLHNLGSVQADAIARAQQVAEKILAGINQSYQLFEHHYIITASIGINLFVCEGENVDELLKRSDMAMYQAKAEGRHTIRFFDPQMQDMANQRVQLELELRRAIAEEHFVLYYQPKVSYHGVLHGYEALLRWQHPDKGLISPMEFIPIAEETGLIVPIGRWVLQEAGRVLAKWQQDPVRKDFVLAVNISARQFKQHDFVTEVTTVLDEQAIGGECLELEITESLLMENVDDAVSKMKALQQRGIRFSLDDFGTGYSSLNYLKDLPLSSLKIDQSFVRDMLVNADDAAIVETVITLAKSLSLGVIAEGVEEAEQAQFLYELGCDLLQGYFYGKPSPMAFERDR